MNERIVDFLYVLMRDHVVPGIAEEVVANHVECRDNARVVDDIVYPPMADDQSCEFSNKGLEQYARDLASRLHA